MNDILVMLNNDGFCTVGTDKMTALVTTDSTFIAMNDTEVIQGTVVQRTVTHTGINVYFNICAVTKWPRTERRKK